MEQYEKDILNIICESIPFKLDIVEKVYNVTKSFDETIMLLGLAHQFCLNPIDILSKYPKYKEGTTLLKKYLIDKNVMTDDEIKTLNEVYVNIKQTNIQTK